MGLKANCNKLNPLHLKGIMTIKNTVEGKTVPALLQATTSSAPEQIDSKNMIDI